MKKLKVIALIMLTIISIAPALGQSQKNKDLNRLLNGSSVSKHATKQSPKSSKTQSGSLTRPTLDKATSVVYNCDNGSVPPEYYYHYTITVTKQTVQLVIKKGENQKTAYNNRAYINSEQYQLFINKLSGQGIKKTKDGTIAEGSGLSAIKVIQNSTVLFSGNEGEDISLSHGNLADAFLQVMSSKMKQQITALD